MSNKIRVSFNNSTVTEETNKRGRMKVTFKLTKEEAEGFKEFRGAFKPPEITDEQFSKDLFMLGAKIIHHEFLKNMEASKSALETQKQEALNASQDTPQPANPEASGDGS